MKYASMDVWYLILLRRLMIRDITRPGWDGDVEGGELPQATKDFLDSLDLDGTEQTEKNDDEADVWTDARERRTLSDSTNPESAGGGASQRTNSTAGFFSPSETSTGGLSGFATPPETESDDDNADAHGVMDPAKMRLDHGLMQILKSSQQRCLCFYTHKQEDLGANRALPAVKRECGEAWTVQHDTLLSDILSWRSEHARALGVDEASVLTTDYCIKVVRATASGAAKGDFKSPRGAEEMRAFLGLIEFQHPGVLGLEEGADVYFNELCILLEESNVMESDALDEEYFDEERMGGDGLTGGGPRGRKGREGERGSPWVSMGLVAIGVSVVALAIVRARKIKR